MGARSVLLIAACVAVAAAGAGAYWALNKAKTDAEGALEPVDTGYGVDDATIEAEDAVIEDAFADEAADAIDETIVDESIDETLDEMAEPTEEVVEDPDVFVDVYETEDERRQRERAPVEGLTTGSGHDVEGPIEELDEAPDPSPQD